MQNESKRNFTLPPQKMFKEWIFFMYIFLCIIFLVNVNHACHEFQSYSKKHGWYFLPSHFSKLNEKPRNPFCVAVPMPVWAVLEGNLIISHNIDEYCRGNKLPARNNFASQICAPIIDFLWCIGVPLATGCIPKGSGGSEWNSNGQSQTLRLKRKSYFANLMLVSEYWSTVHINLNLIL